ncbi:hypothetical protein SAMN05421764_1286 [Donghicola eburneus]|nr:hypothetical protein SAMN05421764_1286 [Donghicola eburneus]
MRKAVGHSRPEPLQTTILSRPAIDLKRCETPLSGT